MRAWTCGVCHQMVFFENSACLTCGSRLGVVPDTRDVTVIEAAGDDWVVPGGDGTAWRSCANSVLADCNWLVAPDQGPLCASCRLTRTRPDDEDAEGMANFAKAEAAKRRLVFQLGELELPIVDRHQDPEGGLAFDLLSSARGHVTTGHANGVITIDLAESDDAYRTRMQQQMREPYRTMLGHFRHEIGHYYWTVLIGGSRHLDAYRTLFGDDREDYAKALERHYANGAPDDWGQRHVSSYATMHPWEDWAETFAHYLHIRDGMQTADAFGILVGGPLDTHTGRRDVALASVPNLEPVESEDFRGVLREWLPLTYALNAVNRSMGKDDLYPFVLAPTVMEKLTFVHVRIHEAERAASAQIR